MTRRLKCGLSLGVCLLAALSVLVIHKNQEPAFQGRSISAWLKDYSSADFSKRSKAESAMLAMGPLAVPYLTDTLAFSDSIVVRLYHKDFIPKRWLKPIRDRIEFASPWVQSRNAAFALQAIGPAADDAVPSLVAALQDPSVVVNQAASEALGKIGAPAVPLLRERLRQTNASDAIWAIRSLIPMGSSALPAAPEVVPFITWPPPDGDFALSALRAMGSEVFPLIIGYLHHTNSLVRRRAVSYFSNLNPPLPSATATNLILPLFHDPDPAVRLAAFHCLHSMRLPADFTRPLWVERLVETNSMNLTTAMGYLSDDYDGILQNNRRLVQLSRHSDHKIATAASNILNVFQLWPKKEAASNSPAATR